MADFSFEFRGLDKLQRNMKLRADVLHKELAIAAYVGAGMVEATAKISLAEGNKSGRVYKRGDKIHRASAPGQPPATDEGGLVGVIHVRHNTGDNTAYVVAPAIETEDGMKKYAKDLEFGTRKMAARPFFAPALEKNRRNLLVRFEQAVRNALRQV